MVVLFSTAPVVADDNSNNMEFKISRLIIKTTKGAITFSVEMAVNRAQRTQGLQWRTRLGDKQGMLFDFGESKLVSMWMKNTIIPLDMLFIADDGKIVSIVNNTTPMSMTTIYSGKSVRAVLEINAGTAKAMGIHTGDRIINGIFAPT